MTAVYRVYIRDAGYRRVGELTDWTSFAFNPRFNDVGTWALETAAESEAARLLTKQGGIIVTRALDGAETIIFSGPVKTEYAFTATTFRAAGYCDNYWLLDAARPTPGIASPPWPDETDVHIGQASQVMRQLVFVNIGPAAPLVRQFAPIHFGPDPMLGSTITSRSNLQSLLAMLADLAITPYAGGLGFYLRQTAALENFLEFIVYAPPDSSADAKFSIDLGTIQAYEDIQQAPEANRVLVLGGDGFGANRTVVEAEDAASIAEWGRLPCTVVDMRGTTDTGELNVRAAEEIAKVSTLTSASVVPFDVPSLQIGRDYDLGSLVTLVTHAGETIDLVRQVEYSLDPEKGPTVIPIVGQGDGSDDEQMATITRTIRNRLSNLERNWNVPPDSIDRSMLVPFLKPMIGEVKWMAGPIGPPGYLLCNGQAVSRTSYSLLFAAIGTTWGVGNGSTTFNVPNLINRSPIGAGGSYGLGELVGATTATIGGHSHTGAPHTHPGSHSHGTVTHSHTGAAHTHPGSHGHDLAAHRHQMGHDHTIWLNPFFSGLTNVDTVAVGHASLGSGATDHKHSVTQPAPQATSVSSDTVTGSGERTLDAIAFIRTGTDSDTGALGASYSGGSGTAKPDTESDSTAPTAFYSGDTGTAAGASISVVQPSAGLLPVIYSGV